MAKRELPPDFTADKLDRKTLNERKRQLRFACDFSEQLSILITQKLLDREILETTDHQEIHLAFRNYLRVLRNMEDFDIQYKTAPYRTIVPTPNILCMLLTNYVTEDLVNHPNVSDIFGDDLEIYRSIYRVFEDFKPASRKSSSNNRYQETRF